MQILFDRPTFTFPFNFIMKVNNEEKIESEAFTAFIREFLRYVELFVLWLLIKTLLLQRENSIFRKKWGKMS